MSARRVLAGSALALLMPASLLVWSESGSASVTTDVAAAAATPARAAVKQRVTLDVLPQIVQPGKRVASADSAKTAITATIKPAKVGRKVTLQVQKGTSWKKVATAKQDAKGRAYFAAAATSGGLPLTYRVEAAKLGKLKAVTSGSESTEQWIAPDFTDEFSGSTLSPTWVHRGSDYEPQSLRMCSKGDPRAVKVGGGSVRLSVIDDPDRGLCKARERGKVVGKYAYRLNGHIGTEQNYIFKYGVAAARIKMHKLRGQHASFWSQPDGGNLPGSDGHEIDIIEYFGDKHPQGGLTSFIHRYKGKRLVKTGSWIKNSESFLDGRRDGWSKAYHVFSVEWTPRTLIFRIDGKETWRLSGNISSAQQQLILSLLASDYELSQMKDKQLPQSMNVDWVRVWETGTD